MINLKHCDNIRQAFDGNLTPEQRYQVIQNVFLTQEGKARLLKPSKTLQRVLGEEQQNSLLELHSQIVERVLAGREKIFRLACFELNCAWYRAGQALLDLDTIGLVT